MTVTKTILDKLDKCYATTIMEIGGKLRYLVATEGVGPCIAYDGSGGSERVWDGPGGTMNIVPIPGMPDHFLATQDFVPTFQAKESKIVHVSWADDSWKVEHLMTIPYLHRFDVCQVGNRRFLVGATLALFKEDKEDWSKPGSVYVGELPADLKGPFPIRPVIGGITKNHGFCKATWKGRPAYLVSGVEGIFVLFIPKSPEGVWESERILDYEVSDMAVCDLDGDGVEELATIEGFHGPKGVIYKMQAGRLESILEHGYEFGHVVWGGSILGKPAFIIGGRRGNRELNCFVWNAATGAPERILIDNTGGPSNIAVHHGKDAEFILAANREIGEVALYELRA